MFYSFNRVARRPLVGLHPVTLWIALLALAVASSVLAQAPKGAARRWEGALPVGPWSQVNLRTGRVLTTIPVVGWEGRGPGISFSLYHNMTSTWGPIGSLRVATGGTGNVADAVTYAAMEYRYDSPRARYRTQRRKVTTTPTGTFLFPLNQDPAEGSWYDYHGDSIMSDFGLTITGEMPSATATPSELTVHEPGLGRDENGNDPLPFLRIGHRWYDPETGRFLQRDPIGIEGGLNTYLYCENNPVEDVDPEGLIRFRVRASKGIPHEAIIVQLGKNWFCRIDFGSYNQSGPGDNIDIGQLSGPNVVSCMRPGDVIVEARNTTIEHDIKTLRKAIWKYANRRYWVLARDCRTVARKLFYDDPPLFP